MGHKAVVLWGIPQLHQLVVSSRLYFRLCFYILFHFYIFLLLFSIQCSEDDTVRLAAIFMEIINEGFDIKQWKAYLAEYVKIWIKCFLEFDFILKWEESSIICASRQATAKNKYILDQTVNQRIRNKNISFGKFRWPCNHHFTFLVKQDAKYFILFYWVETSI